jgi:hypothetical protein
MSLVGDFGAKSVIMFHMNDVFLFHA